MNRFLPKNMNNNSNLVSDDAINKYSKNLTTETNIYPEFFANDETLVNSENRVLYNNDNYDRNNNSNYDHEENQSVDNNITDENDAVLDDDIDNYETKNTAKNTAKSTKQNNKFNYSNTDNNEKNNTTNKTENETENNDEDLLDETTWSKQKLRMEKLKMLRLLGGLKRSGIKLSQNYNMESTYSDMKFEYDLRSDITSKDNAINWMGGAMVLCIKGMEMMNDNYNPFDMKFDGGWSQTIGTNLGSYYEVLGEIYEKNTKSGKPMSPYLKLFLMLTASAVTIQFHKKISESIPETSHKIDEDPNLIRELRQKANKSSPASDKKNKNNKFYEQHNNVDELLKDNQWLKQQEQEHARMIHLADNDSNINKFKNNLVMSESMHSKSQQYSQQANKQSLGLNSINNIQLQQTIKKPVNATIMREYYNLQNINKGLEDLKSDSDSENENENENDSIEITNNSISSKSSRSVISINPNKNKILKINTPVPSETLKLKPISIPVQKNKKTKIAKKTKTLSKSPSSLANTKINQLNYIDDINNYDNDIDFAAISLGSKSKNSSNSSNSNNSKINKNKVFGITIGN
jgi:hypothetical protein